MCQFVIRGVVVGYGMSRCWGRGEEVEGVVESWARTLSKNEEEKQLI